MGIPSPTTLPRFPNNQSWSVCFRRRKSKKSLWVWASAWLCDLMYTACVVVDVFRICLHLEIPDCDNSTIKMPTKKSIYLNKFLESSSCRGRTNTIMLQKSCIQTFHALCLGHTCSFDNFVHQNMLLKSMNLKHLISQLIYHFIKYVFTALWMGSFQSHVQ